MNFDSICTTSYLDNSYGEGRGYGADSYRKEERYGAKKARGEGYSGKKYGRRHMKKKLGKYGKANKAYGEGAGYGASTYGEEQAEGYGRSSYGGMKRYGRGNKKNSNNCGKFTNLKMNLNS